MHAFHLTPRKWRTFNRIMIDVKAALMEWAEGFVGY